MDSPETNPKVPNSSFSASSPTHQESSLFSFLQNLSPIGSVKATKYSQRYQLINFPTPSPVFTSPRLDSQRQTSFLKREESDAADSNVCVKSYTQKQEESELVPSLKKENEHCGSPGSIEEYLAIDDNVESSGAIKQSNSKAGHSFAANVEGKNAPDSLKQLDNQIKCVSGPLNDHFQSDVFLNSLNGAELDHQLFVQEGYNHQQSIFRHLQFEAVMNQKDPNNEIHDSSNFSLASNLRSFETFVQPLVDSTETCISSRSQCPVSLSMGSKDKQEHDRNQSLSENLDTISAGENYFHGEDDWKENRAIVVAGSNTPQSAHIMHHPGDSSRVSRCKQLAVPWETAHHTLQKSNIGEDLNQLSSKKDRKKAKLSSENEGCKRCNCKRSRCLKLYCDCFASGVYCMDSCACENCYNKLEYEDTVLDTRQKIESRNPLAFAPKVVNHPTKSPENIMELNLVTPSSARHKRGCNCKRSKCLKKYCECYQAGVGCSDGCRCEDCSNSFGKKTELIYRRAKRLVTPSYELADITNLSPLPHPHSAIVTSSASRSYSGALQVHPNQGSNLHNAAGYLGFHSSAANHSPKSYGSKDLAELSSESPDSFLFDIFKENYSPDIINNSSTSISPNQKQELSSRSPPGLKSRRKFNLRTVSPFPPLTPYSRSKDGTHKNETISQ